MEIDLELVANILLIVLAVLSVYFSKQYAKAKRVLKELAEAIGVTYEAIEDDKLTKDELKKILREWQDVLNTIK